MFCYIQVESYMSLIGFNVDNCIMVKFFEQGVVIVVLYNVVVVKIGGVCVSGLNFEGVMVGKI